MRNETILARWERAASEIDLSGKWIQVQLEGERLTVKSGNQALLQTRIFFLCLQIALISGVLFLTRNTWPFNLIVALALTYGSVNLTLRILKPGELGVFDLASENWRAPSTGNSPIPIGAVTSISGLYTTQGWDPFSSITARYSDGSEVELLILKGTEEAMAEAICRLLGYLLNCRAAYTGPSGTPRDCYTLQPGTTMRG